MVFHLPFYFSNMKKIKEFQELYPNYKAGDKTATSKVIPLKMEVVKLGNKVFQQFFIFEYYHQLRNALLDGKPHKFDMTVNGKTFGIHVKISKGEIVGICIDTMERICFKTGSRISWTGEAGWTYKL